MALVGVGRVFTAALVEAVVAAFVMTLVGVGMVFTAALVEAVVATIRTIVVVYQSEHGVCVSLVDVGGDVCHNDQHSHHRNEHDLDDGNHCQLLGCWLL